MSPLLEVTEDTPPDMLTGSMDLRLVLPDGNRVRMSVERRTPMMDLLVQVTTAYKISPAGNVLQPYGDTGILPYKPSTPIGALDTWIVHIVPKNQAIQNPSNKINLKQLIPPFEQTLRFQVNLPRNQLYVTRVSGRCTMRDILLQTCNEKYLDHTKYTLRHPKQLDKPLCEEMSIAEYGHNQVTMLSLKDVPTSVSTDDILMMNKYKTQSDSGSGSAASSVSPIPPAQPSKPVRKRRPAPKPPVPQKQQQSETIICHSRTSSDSSGYHEASVLSESPDSNNSSLPDSLPRRSKLPSVESAKVENKLSRSLSNLHQATTSSAAGSGLKPAQSVSCLAPSRKKKPAPAPPVAIVEEKEEKSATLPPCARLLETPEKKKADIPPTKTVPLTNGSTKREPSSVDDQDTESESAQLEAEIERMFEQATREHVSLESGVELSRGPSPDWNWEYRLPAPPTFRDDITTPSLADIQVPLNGNSKQILFEPLESTKEVINEESDSVDSEVMQVNGNPSLIKDIKNELHRTNNLELSNNKSVQIKSIENKKIVNGSSYTDINTENNKQHNSVNESNLINNKKNNSVNKTEKVYISLMNNNIVTDGVSYNKENLQTTPNCPKEIPENNINIIKQNTNIRNQKNMINEVIPDVVQNGTETKSEKVCINIKNEVHQQDGNNRVLGQTKAERNDTIIRVNGTSDWAQEQSAILNELTTVITERQTKPNKEVKQEPIGRPQSLPLKNFSISTYSGSKPVEIYKEKTKKEEEKEPNHIVRSNSSAAEEKKHPFILKRSASAVTNFQRRLNYSRSNENLLEVDECPITMPHNNLRKTTSELSINIDPEEQKEILVKQETGLQSLQVLRSILPQLSQSQGALNTLGQINERKEEKPAVCLTTWGERPKRQVSIKSDRDYVISGTTKHESPVAVTIELVSPTRVSPGTEQSLAERKLRTSVYKSMETGNTKAIKLPPSDLGRLPVVRSVELKKQPSDRPLENGFMNGNDKPFGHLKSRTESRQMRPPTYLFGCEPKVPPPPPAPFAMPVLKPLKPVSQREIKKPAADPREELLESIRSFGKSSLKKVSTR